MPVIGEKKKQFFPASPHQICPTCRTKHKKTEEAKALVKFPYQVVIREILLATNANVDFATQVRVFNVWFDANENQMKARDVKDIFKDYRTFVDNGVLQYQGIGRGSTQKYCGQCGTYYI